MPYKSEAQRRKFHELLRQGKIDPKTVAEWDRASAGMKLPDRAPNAAKPVPTHRKGRPHARG